MIESVSDPALNATRSLLRIASSKYSSNGKIGLPNGGTEPGTRERIVASADGNPLFVEEMLALVRQGGDVGTPSTVRALLQARLDQLAREERTVIEGGAIEGEIFHRGAVVELARSPDVESLLLGLVRKELIHPAASTLSGDEAFRFRHLLFRDAAYDALPKETRAELHERFADRSPADAETLRELGLREPGPGFEPARQDVVPQLCNDLLAQAANQTVGRHAWVPWKWFRHRLEMRC